ncbi:hypothetical protein JB92DRAFT_455450 [Gautieria morchelliformis]|nr:hypothetical protein JB92DRAFT_455450 [Gautieria morchelliformis]
MYSRLKTRGASYVIHCICGYHSVVKWCTHVQPQHPSSMVCHPGTPSNHQPSPTPFHITTLTRTHYHKPPLLIVEEHHCVEDRNYRQ